MSDWGRRPCPLCGLEAETAYADFLARVKSTNCRRCGSFRWTEADVADWAATPAQHARLSALTRQAHEQGRRLLLDRETLRDAAANPEPAVTVKARHLLQAFADRAGHPGDFVTLHLSYDYPLLDAKSVAEMLFFVQHLHQAGLITQPTYPKGAEGDENETVVAGVTFEGWQFLEPLRKTQVAAGRVFVAMSFNDELDVAYQHGIDAAIRDAECEPRMLKGMVHSENISNKILAEIAQAEFVVADTTFGSNGAYFEAGYAMALGRNVIFTCREDHWEHIHFDTAQYPYIRWSEPSDLREKLRDWLLALKGQGGAGQDWPS